MRKQEKKVILWQIQGKKKWMTTLLGNKKSSSTINKIFKGNRRGKEKKSLKKRVEMRAKKTAIEDLLDKTQEEVTQKIEVEQVLWQ